MPQAIRQNTATYVIIGPVVSKTDGVTPLTSETITIKYVGHSNNGSAVQTTVAGAAVHMSDGWYKVPLTAGETNNTLGRMVIWATGPNCLPLHVRYEVLSQSVYDQKFGATAVTDSTIANAVWDTTLPGSYVAGKAGYVLGTNLNATMTSRMASFTLPTNFSAMLVNSSGHVTVGAYATNMSPAAQLLTNSANKLNTDASGQVTVGAYAASMSPASQILTTPANKLTTDASGQVTVGAYASGQSPASLVLTTPANKLATDASGRVTVGTNADKTGYALTQAFPTNFSSLAINGSGQVTTTASSDPWATDLTSYTTAGTAGYIVRTNLNAAVSSRMATFTLPTNFADLAITASTGRVTVGTNADKTGYSLTQAFPTNFNLLSINGSGEVNAGASTDPWAALTASYSTAGTFGKFFQDRLDAAITSRLASTTLPTNFSTLAIDPSGRVTVGSNVDKTGYSITALGTGSITSSTFAADAITALSLEAAAVNKIADALLDRANAVETGLSLRQALRLTTSALAGKVSGAGTTTVTFRNVGDSKDRIVATVDANGNRTALTTDVT